MLELVFVNVNGNFRTEEVFEAAGMVEVEMAEDNSFDVFDIVACGLDCSRKVMLIFIRFPWEDICEWRWRECLFILSATCVKENEADIWMFNQSGKVEEILWSVKALSMY